MLKFPGSLNLLFHNWSSHQFSWKNPSLAQFIPRIYNKIIIKILGYFWGVTGRPWDNSQPPPVFNPHAFIEAIGVVVAIIV